LDARDGAPDRHRFASADGDRHGRKFRPRIELAQFEERTL
jgi:hypothetical protein